MSRLSGPMGRTPEPDAVQTLASPPVLSAEMDFDVAAGLILDYLQEHVPLELWSVTRVENGLQTYLYLNEDNSYGKSRGDSGPWQDSFCIQMAAGSGPGVAPDAQSVAVYAGAGANEATTIGAYAGAVIKEPSGGLFGTICGIDASSRLQDPTFTLAGPLLGLLGQLLTMVLAADRSRDQAARDMLQVTLAAELDALTGLNNRRAWDRIVGREEERFRRFGDPTVAVMLDLDGLKEVNDTQGHVAGDVYIQAAAAALHGSVKSTDPVARVGGDEFGVLLRGCTETQAESAIERLYAALEKAGVAGSIGWAPVTVMRGFPAALAEADAAMYAAKAARRARLRSVAAG